LNPLHAYYAEAAASPCPARQVGWRGPLDQKVRFALCAEVLALDSVSSVLDVGCGLGDLVAFFRARGFAGRYLGVDALPTMIARARQRHPDEAFTHLTVGLPEIHSGDLNLPEADLVVACGTFSLRIPNYEANLRRSIAALWERTRGALILILPHRRGRHSLTHAFAPNDPLVYHTHQGVEATMHEVGARMLQIRSDVLGSDLAVIAFRQRQPLVEGMLLRNEITPTEAAHLWWDRGEAAAALAILDAHPPATPAEPDDLVLRARVLRALGRDDDARSALEAVLAEHPQHLAAQLELAPLRR